MSVLLVAMLSFTQIQLPPSARRDDITVHVASDLVAPCREEAEAYFVGRGRTTYQWAATHKSRGNVLHVQGRLRVNQDDVQVRCRLPMGARLTYLVLEVDRP